MGVYLWQINVLCVIKLLYFFTEYSRWKPLRFNHSFSPPLWNDFCCCCAARLGRAQSRTPLRGLHQPHSPGRLRGPAHPSLQLGGASVGVPPHDELQRAESRLRLRQVPLVLPGKRRHSPAQWLPAAARLPPVCPPQRGEETPVHWRAAVGHPAGGAAGGMKLTTDWFLNSRIGGDQVDELLVGRSGPGAAADRWSFEFFQSWTRITSEPPRPP